MDMLGEEDEVGEEPRAVAGRLLARVTLGGVRIERAFAVQGRES